ncbi:hypothetical protein DACRYDRAFT_109684 [Dacryopinax primogenitus]|uniref:Uncharacterized protein n=1 Tax=Dacryopinax primogenitus (strain DJM 731) TaxID=1858805 RepID=M5FR75_DACPD|nr:uncharacterized protein DACRYDRAFT_109684 [Dacryopinax primogenitus]EJT99585.1 hypothetical protein DACRYDRAFT_109684 [Dacryopinax primogenitus]
MEVTSLVVAAAAFAVAYTAEGLPRKMPSIPSLRLPSLATQVPASVTKGKQEFRGKVRRVRFVEVEKY